MPEVSLNNRRHRRVTTRVTVRISTIDSETDPATGKPYFRSTEETCANLSRGGAFIETDDPISPGRRLLVEIDLPGGPALQTIGRVAWSKSILSPTGKLGQQPGSGIGVEFLGGSPEHFAALESHLARRQRRAQRARPAARMSNGAAGRGA